MQLLIRFQSHDRSAFREAYDGAREERDQAGLTQLQLWEEADAPDTLWALYGVAEREKAEAWLAKTSALGTHLTGHDAHFLATA